MDDFSNWMKQESEKEREEYCRKAKNCYDCHYQDDCIEEDVLNALMNGERRRMMKNTFYQPLTPTFRSAIQESISQNMAELNTCQNTVYVSAQKTGLNILSYWIESLPDGYLIPMKRN